MKHPVDTSKWGDFVVGELFELTGIKQVKSQHHVVEDPNGIPFVVQSNKNNMVKMKADKQWLIDNDEPVVEGNAIVLGVTLPVVSYQPYEFGASQVITARSEHLNELRGLFITSVINSFVIPKYSYVYKPGIQKYKQDVIPLPLKPSADPKNYTQDDIDWDYMDTVMSRVTTRAKDRLANLPQPTDKKKTPVNTSAWGEFKARDLFGPSKLGKYHNPKDLHASDDGYEYICATTMNNGINQTLSCVIGNDLTIPFRIGGGLSLTPSHIIAWGKQNPYFTYHENPCVTSQGMYFVEVKNKTRNQIHFLITVLNKLSSGFSYTNCLTGKIFDELSIPLPLEPSANPSNYDQTDIDWDYMDRFMHGIEEKAHERLVELNSYMNEDD